MLSSNPSGEIGIKSILIAYDFSEASRKTLRHSLAIARHYGAKLHLAYVVSSIGYGIAGPEASRLAAEGSQRDMHQLETDLLKSGELAGLQYEFVVREGNVWEQIQLIVEQKRLDAVVMGTHKKLKQLEVQTIADLRRLDLATLEDRFGRYGLRLYELARGIDNSEVVPDRPTQSISAEDTFEHDVLLAEMEPMIRRLAEHTWAASRKESRIARTVVLKLKTSEFKILTRSHTPGSPPASCEELTSIALSLRERVGLSPHQRFRLVGVGLSNFCDPEDAPAQSALFA